MRDSPCSIHFRMMRCGGRWHMVGTLGRPEAFDVERMQGERSARKGRRANMKGITRRGFLAAATVAAASATAAGLAGCAPSGAAGEGSSQDSGGAKTRWSWETKPDPILESDIAETIDADICIVGFGATGAPAALAAAQSGAKVVVLQKESTVVTNGWSAAAFGSRRFLEAGANLRPCRDIRPVRRAGQRARQSARRAVVPRTQRRGDGLPARSDSRAGAGFAGERPHVRLVHQQRHVHALRPVQEAAREHGGQGRGGRAPRCSTRRRACSLCRMMAARSSA